MNRLPNELVLHIASFLGQFERYYFSISSKYLYELLYEKENKDLINSWCARLLKTHAKMFDIIRRINTDGVVYGECLQCGQLKLLYTQNEDYTICLEKCKLYCVHCDKYVYVHNMNNGCPACLNDLVMI